MRRSISVFILVALLATACADNQPTDPNPESTSSVGVTVPSPCAECVFGPHKFVRRGQDRVITTFPATPGGCTLTVEGDGRPGTSVAIWLNGSIVVNRTSMDSGSFSVDHDVLASNTLEVSVRGGRERYVTIWIQCGDTINVTPDTTVVTVGAQQQFTVSGSPGPYLWSVNGIDGGSLASGTVDGAGLYQAPAALPSPAAVTLCARISAAPSVSDCSAVFLVPPPPLELSPPTAAVPTQESLHFVVTGPPGPYVFSVNGVDGGNQVFGGIDGSGLYVAPDDAPAPAQVEVCVRLMADATQSDCSIVTITLEGIVVFNEPNLFGRWAMLNVNPDNGLLFRNLVSFTSTKPRGAGTEAIVDLGHGSYCQGGDMSPCEPFDSIAVIAATAGVTLRVQDSTDLLAIPASTKVLFLWVPLQYYTTAEVNALKRFVVEGGRLVFMGASEPAYTSWGGGMALENDLLSRLGATLRDTGGNTGCYSSACLFPVEQHQITAGMTKVTVYSSAYVDAGPYDVPLYAWFTGRLLAAIGPIDPTPLAE